MNPGDTVIYWAHPYPPEKCEILEVDETNVRVRILERPQTIWQTAPIGSERTRERKSRGIAYGLWLPWRQEMYDQLTERCREWIRRKFEGETIERQAL